MALMRVRRRARLIAGQRIDVVGANRVPLGDLLATETFLFIESADLDDILPAKDAARLVWSPLARSFTGQWLGLGR